MMDLDLGHEQLDVGRASRIPTKPINRGKLLTPEKLKELGEWGRYKDVDGDGIPYRTVPGDGMPAYFTRGSGHNAKGQYSERPDDYVEQHGPADAQVRDGAHATCRSRSSRRSPARKIGFIGYGTSHWAIDESRDQLREETDVKTSYFRLRAYPFTDGPGRRSSTRTSASTSSSRTATRSCCS